MNKFKFAGLILGPLLFIATYAVLKAFTGLSPEACKVLATAGWMVTWWVSEPVNIAVTALIPMVFLPLLGVMNIAEATTSYGNPVIFLFMGGFIIALALEKHKLHERIALNIIRITGTSGNGIIAGFSLAAALISMWISNTATTIMMLPIALSVTQLVNDMGASDLRERNQKNFATGLMLSIAYASSIGGLATIIGTPPNVVMAGLYRQTYQQDIYFLEWMRIGVPVSLCVLGLCYLMITRWIFPNHLKRIKGSSKLIRGRLAALGGLTKPEKMVLGVFLLTSFSWVFRQYLNVWLSTLFYGNGAEVAILNDTTIAMAGGLLMFTIPVSLRKGEFILTWADMKRLPWGILILFGGGLCLAKSLEESGLIQLIGEEIAGWQHVNYWALLLALCALALFLTELMSNTALTTIFVPVVFGIADGLGYDAKALAIPVALVASCAFCLPVSTPPNAIVFAGGHIKLFDMVRGGIFLNLLSLIVVVVLSVLLL